ncbi:hypothetical protein Vadar_027642 [Vaccinium darrowii]|uniref:Uncharacterized protein n=1 Tax=Vaccinium darrowii TaxID=229202 RepID=A0ACB7Y273_9ERIC|nr:hypothetical protein Vadar_027642 [Vaccinium darrowii]
MDDTAIKGSFFTWSNKRGGQGYNKSRIDRVLIILLWLTEFPVSEALTFPPCISDHCSLVISIPPHLARHRPFQFFNFWMAHLSFKDLVGDSWGLPVRASPMPTLCIKLRRLKPVRRTLNKPHFQNISARVALAREELEKGQLQNLSSSSNRDGIEQEKIFLSNFCDLAYAEVSFFKQKARIKWLALGDKNSKFLIRRCLLTG